MTKSNKKLQFIAALRHKFSLFIFLDN